MNSRQSFALEQILQHLCELNIPFSVNGTENQKEYKFKSIRCIEEQGIYFLIGDLPTPVAIRNSVILYPEAKYEGEGNVTIQVDNPQLVFYQLMEKMISHKEKKQGIHPTAIISNDCHIHPESYIGPYCVLEGCVVEKGVSLHSHITIMSGTVVEENVIIEPHSTIGATGVAWIWNPLTRSRVIQPQIGYTRIKKGTFLGSDVTVVRGSINEETSIGKNCVIAHGSKIGHGSVIGDECHFANNISIAGNVSLGEKCFLGSGAVVRPQTRLADSTVVGAGAVVVKHCEEPGILLMGAPAKKIKKATEKMSGVPLTLDCEE